MFTRWSGDKVLSIIVTILVVGGLAIFASASLGLLARPGQSLLHIGIEQVVFGLIPGFIALVFIRFMPPKWIPQMVIPLYLGSIILTLLVFIPHLGYHTLGATRWIQIGSVTIQPAEFLKVAVILMLASYLAHAKKNIKNFRYGLLPFLGIVGIPCAILLAQPNTSTMLIVGTTCVALYFLAGAPWRDFAVVVVAALLLLSVLIYLRPYLLQRIETFMHPTESSLTSGYQIQQSLIAIGSGKFLGRGYGQSVQKYNYLPEANGDSIFAVYGEEFGFVGTALMIGIFIAFAARGLMIAGESATTFGALTVTGLTLLITLSAFMNMGAMLGVVPLTGLPLPFISQGGTALLAALASVGIILNIAAHRSKTKIAL
jgi:cell division protein FtsW